MPCFIFSLLVQENAIGVSETKVERERERERGRGTNADKERGDCLQSEKR